MTEHQCSRCPGFLYAAESRESGLCHGCRSGQPEQTISAKPPPATEPDKNHLIGLVKSGPLTGSVWRDVRGDVKDVYRVVATALRGSTLDVMVVYAGADGVPWILPLAEFGDRRFTPA